MNDLVAEWVDKAEGDYRTAEQEFRVRREPTYDAVCFHAQQCAEKYLKGLLSYHQIPFRRVNDLEVLLETILPAITELELIRGFLLLLNDYAVEFRYPGESATREEAREAIKTLRTVRTVLRQKLSLP